MVQICKDKCIKAIEGMTKGKGNSPYKQGFKWCSVCRKFFFTSQLLSECPCCGTRLRNKPRINRINKELYNEFLGIKRIE
jgi:rRNA maturation endonuclease Nob1